MKYLYLHNYDITNMFNKLSFNYKDIKESYSDICDENWNMKKLIEKYLRWVWNEWHTTEISYKDIY